MKKKILVCVGTRPNFTKVIRLKNLLLQKNYEYKLLHTGQHFDQNMSKIFLEQLKLGEPDFYLGVEGGDINETTSIIISKAGNIFKSYQPDIVIVVGDVNSTFACAFAAASLNIPIAHIESGLRSFRKSMPEERNRILTDHLSSLLFVTDSIGVENLKNEGLNMKNVKLVGNSMIDALDEMMPIIDVSHIIKKLSLEKHEFVLATFHRPINVDNPESLNTIITILESIAKFKKVVLPIHPRTLRNLKEFELIDRFDSINNIMLVEPLGYIDFIKLLKNAFAVISDSGGMQAESSHLNIPCITLREETELPSTLEYGTNTLCALSETEVMKIFNEILTDNYKCRKNISLWDGKASERIVAEIHLFLNN